MKEFIFKKENFIGLLIGLALIVIGFLLMSGGGSEDPKVFNPDIFGFRRISLAPTLVLLGFATQVVAIRYQKKKKDEDKPSK